MRVSHTTLRALAGAVWYTGAGVLLVKGSGYLLEAGSSGSAWGAVVGAVLGVAGGLLRGRTMFLRACRRNLARIEALEAPRVWQFFRPRFFAALVLMMAAGRTLSWIAGQGYWATVTVGGLELVIGTALLTSSVAFWRPPPEEAGSGVGAAGDEREPGGSGPAYGGAVEEPAA